MNDLTVSQGVAAVSAGWSARCRVRGESSSVFCFRSGLRPGRHLVLAPLFLYIMYSISPLSQESTISRNEEVISPKHEIPGEIQDLNVQCGGARSFLRCEIVNLDFSRLDQPWQNRDRPDELRPTVARTPRSGSPGPANTLHPCSSPSAWHWSFAAP